MLLGRSKQVGTITFEKCQNPWVGFVDCEGLIDSLHVIYIPYTYICIFCRYYRWFHVVLWLSVCFKILGKPELLLYKVCSMEWNVRSFEEDLARTKTNIHDLGLHIHIIMYICIYIYSFEYRGLSYLGGFGEGVPVDTGSYLHMLIFFSKAASIACILLENR